jgi:hypothetical protein
VELYIHSPTRLDGILLNEINTDTFTFTPKGKIPVEELGVDGRISP